MDYQYHGVHIWFWVHSGASIGSLGLLICGQIALGKGIESWGRSQSLFSIAHHSIGWISILVFVLMVILGKLRNAKKRWLNVLLRAHSVVGFMLYFFNSSPSLRRCGREGYPTGISVEMYITMAWTGLDLVFHGFLTALQMTADRTLGIRRPMFCPIMPILSPHSHKDMKRSGFRKVLLVLYVILSALFMLAATLHLGLRFQPEVCTIGEMSCKAALGCTPLGLAMCKKLKYDICSRKGRRVIFH
ncbi:hypothetical protein Ocin01_16561 [Orchesella cincta]|uniref:Cytochrome b561 domain-containing protein n=1 Tax=Orchesella cincta TaxID=48709 RepID=A0A1D2MB30_ORCCI|nr:hypothetical protein Ocin01_16561 [Orchesella cincta]